MKIMPKQTKSKKVKIQNTAILVNALATLVMAFKETRRYLVEHSITFFAWYYFGIKLYDQQIKYLKGAVKNRRLLILAPCNHGKTEAMTKIFILWKICRNRNIRIILGSKALELAELSLESVKHELEKNKRLAEDYGQFYNRFSKWQEKLIYVIREKNLKDPTVRCIGIGTSITGGRADLIILDDPIDEHSVEDPKQRKKLLSYINTTIKTRLEPDGTFILIGTRKHNDDLYNSTKKISTFKIIEDKALTREPDSWEIVKLDRPIIRDDGTEQWHKVVINGDDEGECLCPERWPVKALLMERFEIGTVAFNREYQNIVVDDESALFKIQWLNACRDENLSYVIGDLNAERRSKYVQIFQGNDPSLVISKKIAEAHDSDWQVITTVGLCEDGTRELIGIYRERGQTPDEVIKSTKAEYDRFTPNFHLIETNAFGIIHAHNLIEKTGLKIMKHYTGANKNDLYSGVPGLSVLFENRKFRLPYKTEEDKKKTDEFINEFHSLGFEAHDDIVMSMWILECGIERYLKGQARLRKIGGEK